VQGLTVGTAAGFKADEILKSCFTIKTKGYAGVLHVDKVKQKKLNVLMLNWVIVASELLISFLKERV